MKKEPETLCEALQNLCEAVDKLKYAIREEFNKIIGRLIKND